MSSRLRSYLEKIEQGKPLNFGAFLRLLAQEGVLTNVALEKVRKQRVGTSNLYRVESIDPDLLNALREKALAPGSTRATAAVANKSHSVRVNGSFILIRKGLDHPSVAMIDAEGDYVCPVAQGTRVVVIENRQNFLSIERTSSFLQEYCGLDISSGYDIIFGAGNEITNSLHSRFLDAYEEVLMLLDLDPGGLSMAKTLAGLCPGAAPYFLLPLDIDERLSRINGHATQAAVEQAFTFYQTTPFLHTAASLIVRHRKTLEQESYLV